MESAPKLLVIALGGLGWSQLYPTGFLWWKQPGLMDALKQIPEILVYPSPHWNGFKDAGYKEFAANYPDTPIYAIGHSFGVDPAIQVAIDHPDYAANGCVGCAVISPVWHDKPNPVCDCLVLKPTASQFPQADVMGIPDIVIPNTDHNSICHDPATISTIVSHIKSRIQ